VNRFSLGMIAVATIVAVAPVSEAAVKAPSAAPFTWAGAYVGANVGSIWTRDQIPNWGRLDAVHSDALKDFWQHRQFACIKVGHRLQC
jgi:hypothetical protein